MKKAVMLMVFVLCGCSRRGPDSQTEKIKELEIQIASLQSNIDTISTNQWRINIEFANKISAVMTNDIGIMHLGETIGQNIDSLSNRFYQLENQFYQLDTSLNKVVDRIERAAQTKQQTHSITSQTMPPTKDGIPIDVYQSIEAAASRKWPNEYSMQVYEIDKEVEAYRKLH